MNGKSSAFHNAILRKSATDIVSFAALLLDTRFAVLRFFDGTVIANDKQAPIDVEAELAARVTSREEQVVVLTAEELSPFPGINFYAVVPLRDADGRILGSLAVLDAGKRLFTWSDRQSLSLIAAQINRFLEIDAFIDRIEARLRRVEAFVDAMPVAAYVIENGRFTCVNAKFAQALGFTKEEILALSSAEQIVVSEQQDFVREMIRRRLLGIQHDVRYVTQIRSRDGRILDADIHGAVAFVDGRRMLIGAATDISAHSIERRRLQESEEYFRALTENVSDIIAILDAQGFVSYVNRSVESALGYSPDEVVGKEYCSFLHPDDRERVQDALRRTTLRADAPFSSTAYRFRSKNGSWREFESVGANLLTHPQVRGIVLNTRDITDRKVLEQQVEQLHRLTSLGRLAAQVAHEFNNVLMGIQPSAENLRRRMGDDPQLNRAVDAISSSVARGKRITTDILRFARPAQFTLQTVQVQHLIGQAIEEIQPMLPQNITLENATPDAPMYVHADPAQMSQVLINLMLNARDAMPIGGMLTVAVHPGEQTDFPNADAYAHFTVTDTGEGIAGEDLPYIFEPLFTTKKTGTGLGLSVVWQVVATHRGQVSVESARGKGTTVHVFIPATAAPSAVDSAGDAERGQPARKRHVLIVEDIPAVADGLRWSLEAEGFEVSVAMTAAEVLPRLAERTPDAVVLDLGLPDEDGRKVYEWISSVSSVPVIFSSGHASEKDIERLLTNARTAFLMKPYKTEELLRTIDQLLETEKNSDELTN